jgi:hypothetical protein
MKTLLLSALVLATVFMLAAPVAAVTYSLTVGTDSGSYIGSSTIHITGQVSPAPGPNTGVAIRIFNPSKVLVTADEVHVNGTTGSYSDAIVAGGSSGWVAGNYVVNATWGAYGPVVFSTASFAWSVSGTTTTTTSTTSSTSSSSATSTTSTTSTSSTSSTKSSSTTSSSSSSPTASITSSATMPTTSASTSSSSGGGIPEFPYQAITATILTVIVIASYLVARRTMRPRNPSL